MLKLWLKNHNEGWRIEAEEIVALKQYSLPLKTGPRECKAKKSYYREAFVLCAMA